MAAGVPFYRYETDTGYDTCHLVREYDADAEQLTTQCGITFVRVAMRPSWNTATDTTPPAPARCGNCPWDDVLDE